MTVVSVSSKPPFKVTAMRSKVDVTGFSGSGAPVRFFWLFDSILSGASIQDDGTLKGVSFRPSGSPLFQWEAKPVVSFDDHFAASLAAVDPELVLESINTGRFIFAPLQKETVEWPGFLPVSALLKDRK